MRRLMRFSVVAVLFFPQTGRGEIQKLYFVGNSLTVDSEPFLLGPAAVAQGVGLAIGQHISCSSSLATIAGDPSSICVASPAAFGRFDNALPNFNWDHVSFQSSTGQNSTLGDDVSAFAQLSGMVRQNPANAGTQLYLFQSWPLVQELAHWQAPVADTMTQATVHQRDYFSHLYNRIRLTEPGTRLIPVGEVFFHVRQAIEAGQIAGVSSFYELYRDPTHASYGLGRFVANTTLATALFHANQSGLASPYDTIFSGDAYTMATRNQLQTLIWQVVMDEPGEGVGQTPLPGDYNRDGSVTLADLHSWRARFGSNSRLSADGNLDRHVNAADYTVWRDAWADGSSVGFGTAVAEPSSAAIAETGAVLSTVAVKFRRRRPPRAPALTRFGPDCLIAA